MDWKICVLVMDSFWYEVLLCVYIVYCIKWFIIGFLLFFGFGGLGLFGFFFGLGLLIVFGGFICFMWFFMFFFFVLFLGLVGLGCFCKKCLFNIFVIIFIYVLLIIKYKYFLLLVFVFWVFLGVL